MWNPMNDTVHNTVWDSLLLPDTTLEPFNIMFQNLGMFVEYGWIYLAVNFYTDPATNRASVWGYMATHNQCELVSNIFNLPGPIVDSDDFIWCLGCQVTDYENEAIGMVRPLNALIREWYILAGDILERYEARDAYGFQCHDYCQICRRDDQPVCFQDLEEHHLHYWDFAPFRWYRPVWDYGQERAHIGLAIVMVGQGLYTHNNGMWFDGGRVLVPAPPRWLKFSFTVDAWFKFYDAVGGTIMQSTSPVTRNWRLYFQGPNTVLFNVNGFEISNTFTFNAATDYNKWMIVQASSAKNRELGNKLCVKMNDEAIYCEKTTTIELFIDDFTPGAPQTLIIGAGISGFIRKIKLYDYPKMEPDMELMYKVAPQCYKFHHSQTDCEICDIDYNFTCYTDCAERKEWDYDCKTCEASCFTCWGNDRFHCFSCYETLYRFHERCTCCPETCGDGRFLDDSEYDCDDGNNNADDGCDQN